MMTFSELTRLAKLANLEYSISLPQGMKAEDIEIKDFCLNSKLTSQGSVFVCTKGEFADGHDYAKSCLESGTVALLAEKKLAAEIEEKLAVLYVENSHLALQKMAIVRRDEFNGLLIAVTGSCGKTSVKEMLFQVLSHKGKAAKNHLNLNTQVGVAISILNTDNDEDFWILEAGINQEHDMQEIAQILRPNIGLIINASNAHAEGLPKGAAYYKSQLFSYIKKDEKIAKSGLTFACKDYPDLVKEVLAKSPDTVFYSILDEKADYYAKYKGLNADGKGIFTLKIKNDEYDILAPMRSDYGAENCLAIACLASFFMTKDEIIEAFKHTTSPRQRFEIFNLKDCTLIDDSYNANPLSFKRMISGALEYCTLDGKRTKPLIAIAGAMLELGEIAQREHEILGQEFALAKTEKIYYIGPYAENFAKGLKNASFEGTLIFPTDAESFANDLKAEKATNCVFLVKGSRSIQLERYAQKLKEIYG